MNRNDKSRWQQRREAARSKATPAPISGEPPAVTNSDWLTSGRPMLPARLGAEHLAVVQHEREKFLGGNVVEQVWQEYAAELRDEGEFDGLTPVQVDQVRAVFVNGAVSLLYKLLKSNGIGPCDPAGIPTLIADLSKAHEDAGDAIEFL